MLKLRKLFGGLGNSMFQMAYLTMLEKEGKIPDIYLQDYTLWEKYSKHIKKMYGVGIASKSLNYVSLHIRRGDYNGNPFYVDLTLTDYYKNAIAQFPKDRFLVFCADRQEGSDDVKDQDWVMNWLQTTFGDRFELHKGKDEIEDMNTMASCKAHIMANSSFSWWASFLGSGKTIAPLQWFSDGVERIKLLPEWEKI